MHPAFSYFDLIVMISKWSNEYSVSSRWFINFEVFYKQPIGQFHDIFLLTIGKFWGLFLWPIEENRGVFCDWLTNFRYFFQRSMKLAFFSYDKLTNFAIFFSTDWQILQPFLWLTGENGEFFPRLINKFRYFFWRSIHKFHDFFTRDRLMTFTIFSSNK